jgi:hypothetical protein
MIETARVDRELVRAIFGELVAVGEDVDRLQLRGERGIEIMNKTGASMSRRRIRGWKRIKPLSWI